MGHSISSYMLTLYLYIVGYSRPGEVSFNDLHFLQSSSGTNAIYFVDVLCVDG